MIGEAEEIRPGRSCKACRYYRESDGPSCHALADMDKGPDTGGACEYFNPTNRWLLEFIHAREGS